MTRVSGSGEVKLKGETQQQSVYLSQSGKHSAVGLHAQHEIVNLAGSGTAEVRASKTLTVDLASSGSVYYYGNSGINTNISGSGKVLKKG
ncbi:DUF2807 domain-containing protein [Pontibacter silvestris]|nr:DUF2807 domain-containing protein [Pontibacter silvestris]